MSAASFIDENCDERVFKPGPVPERQWGCAFTVHEVSVVHNSRISPGGIDGEFMIQIVLKPGSGKPGGTGELRQSGFLEFLFFECGECFNIVDKLTCARRTENGKADFHIFAVILEPFGFYGQDNSFTAAFIPG